ncbi:hypothetical protein [Cupriavidus oxalaticus]|uniref:hypothetical protein n=1 Tax=Cupriavidus oxalaticus TaxID=96344 RepID=UPI00197AD659|nr:hypothetical protein [Cupriavidus oxalaticus]
MPCAIAPTIGKLEMRARPAMPCSPPTWHHSGVKNNFGGSWMQETCWWKLCFFPLPTNGQKFFGFAEFLAALALMVLAWTIADVRYRFRIRTAALPLQLITFWVIAVVGVLTLLTDLWRTEGWHVLSGGVISPAVWQAILGGAIFISFIAWVWFAFVRPSVFSKRNSKWFGSEIYRAILRGIPEELSVVADELGRSAKSLIAHSTEIDRFRKETSTADKKRTPAEKISDDANAIFHLIADRHFCKALVGTASGTIYLLIEEITRQKKYRVPLGIFMKNITTEAIADKGSFVYREVAGYETGYLGHHKPLTSTLYGNYALIDSLDDVFDVDYQERNQWGWQQWEAYCRLVMMAFRNYASSKLIWNHSTVLFRAFDTIGNSIGDLSHLKDFGPDWWKNDNAKNLKTAVEFAKKAAKALDKLNKDNNSIKLRRRDNDYQKDIYDLVANLMFEVLFSASKVTETKWICWSIQHNDVWSEFFDKHEESGLATKIIQHKLRRLIYNDIKEMEKFPNFKGASILGLVLNVSWLKEPKKSKPSYAITKAVLAWVRKHYSEVAMTSPKVAATALVDGMEYDQKKLRLIKTGMEFLDREPSRAILDIEPPKSYVGPSAGPKNVGRRRKLVQRKLFG